MKVKFQIQYNTVWGENLVLSAGKKKFPMSYNPGGLWTADVEKCTAAMLADYTYQVFRDGILTRSEWKHHTRKVAAGTKELVAADFWNDCPPGSVFLRENAAPKFNEPGYKGAGTAIPVFALRSEEGFGVGEFNDLKKMADWAARTNQSVLQLLPINDTTDTHTWQDSYPYNPISNFALHPQYINLPAAGLKVDAAYKKLRAELNALPQIDYERVNNEKTRLLLKLYAKDGAALLESAPFKAFFKANKSWLPDYAAFCSARDNHPVEFYYFVQYHLDKQMKEAVAYAHSKGVYFKGDLPIGVNRESVEARNNPHLFNMDSQAGAPPDAFSEDGQNWGFPTYNWEEMAKDGYAWWKDRFGKMAEYFDAYRIDHILGFFRIWEIPVPEKSGLMGHFAPALPYQRCEIEQKGLPVDGLFLEDPHKPGYFHPRISCQKTEAFAALQDWQKTVYNDMYNDFFYHRHNDFWKAQALRKLPELLSSTGMLTCGEDLGMIPACVPEVMDSLRILSLEVQRMPKDPADDFGHPERYPYLCVCTTSSHDTTPLREWWTEDRALTQKYYNEILHRSGTAPEMCSADICEQILRQHLESPAMLAIFPLQDWMAIDDSVKREDAFAERINIPANPRHYWRYRMHLTLEDLLSRDAFNDKVASMVSSTGRK